MSLDIKFSPNAQWYTRYLINLIPLLLFVIINSSLVEFSWKYVRGCIFRNICNKQTYSRMICLLTKQYLPSLKCPFPVLSKTSLHKLCLVRRFYQRKRFRETNCFTTAVNLWQLLGSIILLVKVNFHENVIGFNSTKQGIKQG